MAACISMAVGAKAWRRPANSVCHDRFACAALRTMAAVRKSRAFMTLAEFLVWNAPSRPPWQPIDGVPQAMAPANGTHSVMQSEVSGLIRDHLAVHRPGCRVLTNLGAVPRVDSGTTSASPA
jgi:hypothetical protein